MGRPPITPDQREIVVTMLANAIRKDAHLRRRAEVARGSSSQLQAATAGRRAEPSKRYLEGMRDLLKVLFAEGPELADECLEEAYGLAMGMPNGFSENGQTYH